jgi:hypothetical protein
MVNLDIADCTSRPGRLIWTEQSGQVGLDGQIVQVSRDRSAWTGLTEQFSKDRPAWTGQPGQVSQDWPVWTGQQVGQ